MIKEPEIVGKFHLSVHDLCIYFVSTLFLLCVYFSMFSYFVSILFLLCLYFVSTFPNFGFLLSFYFVSTFNIFYVGGSV